MVLDVLLDDMPLSAWLCQGPVHALLLGGGIVSTALVQAVAMAAVQGADAGMIVTSVAAVLSLR